MRFRGIFHHYYCYYLTMQRYYHQLLVNMMKIICVPFMLAPSSANMWLVPLVFSAFSLLLLPVLCMIITRANAIIIRGSTQYDNMWMWAWDEKEFAVKMDQSTKPFKMDPAKYSNKLMDFSPPPTTLVHIMYVCWSRKGTWCLKNIL